MNKQDLIIVILLLLLLVSYPFMYSRIFPAEKHSQEVSEEPAQPFPTEQERHSSRVQQVKKPAEELAVSAKAVAPLKLALSAQPESEIKKIRLPEHVLSLNTPLLKASISSWGGGIKSVELKEYRENVADSSAPVILDFSDIPALTYYGVPDMSEKDNFTITENQTRSSILIERTTKDGLRLQRTISIQQDYQFAITDKIFNQTDTSLILPEHTIYLGPMKTVGNESTMMRQMNFGIDALQASASEAVLHWARKLPSFFKKEMKKQNKSRLPETISKQQDSAVNWIAAKNKFFVQILVPDQVASAYILHAKRKLLPGEADDPSIKPRAAEIESVSASLVFPEVMLAPGQSSLCEMSYYVGPKKLSILKNLGMHQEEVMDFGWWSPVCKILLRLLNIAYSIIPNYGIAIIVLTILIRVLFWPLTHKSTQSMKKMQDVQPLMMEIRKKYKDNPKKMQAETMALYKEHKVNPMGGCLPMIIQIPVFIALFVVLRSAIELRFAGFLWIKDLSEPEGLFANILPIPLNILPILMAVTMVWQQKLTTPATTDPGQQKIMAVFMPIMMLVLFYMMPSALVLYWTANQCLVIIQQLMLKKRSAVP